MLGRGSRFLSLKAIVLLAVAFLVAACASTSVTYSNSSRPTAARDFGSLLHSESSPVEVLIVGDDSGKTVGGWVYLAAQQLGNRFDRRTHVRPIVINGNDMGNPSDVVAWPKGQRSLTIWNLALNSSVDIIGSKIADLVPLVSPDLVVVSNGYSNVRYRSLARDSISLGRACASLWPTASIAFVIQPFEQYGSVGAENQRDLKNSALVSGYSVIDVASAFSEDRVQENLYSSDSNYPSIDGYRLWAKVFSSRVGSVSLGGGIGG